MYKEIIIIGLVFLLGCQNTENYPQVNILEDQSQILKTKYFRSFHIVPATNLEKRFQLILNGQERASKSNKKLSEIITTRIEAMMREKFESIGLRYNKNNYDILLSYNIGSNPVGDETILQIFGLDTEIGGEIFIIESKDTFPADMTHYYILRFVEETILKLRIFQQDDGSNE